ncbi:hypothetical protein LPJ73_001178 [Coemansia sp. RSA 2703]|nr:hypothetical protein LPJ73_001178 [Coemansia sp. RSA 2703]KAJ2374563.1 hypothetical protein IW150_003033 [Coemansia sp. RSA 2607]KAJ2396695.1 hypothetical protein GGI05_001004 [Coemansia sp. RSA 2603]
MSDDSTANSSEGKHTKTPSQSDAKQSGKKGKVFATPSSMMDILNQVSQVEETRRNKKLERQNVIKKLVYDKEKRSVEKKKKKANRFEEIKNQLRQGYRLSGPTNKPEKKAKKPKSMKRTISTVNREWSAAVEGSSSPLSDGTSATIASVALAASSNVVELTPKNFKDVVDGSKDVLVKFYAPWCGHCKNMAEDYEKLAEGYKHTEDVVIAEVNADDHRDLGTKFGVQGFPTLKFFAKGEDIKTPVDYSSGRDLDSLTSFVTEKTGIAARIKKPVTHVVSLDYEKFKDVALDESKFVLVKFYAPWCGHCKTLAPIYAQLSEVFQNDENVVIASYDASEDTKIKSEYPIQGFPTLYAFPAGKDAEKIEYEGGRNLEDLVAFVNSHAGTQRTTEGLLDQTAGRLEALDAIARKYIAASKAQRTKLIAKAKATADKVKDTTQVKFAKYYVKVMEKMSSATDFASKEAERLAGIVKSGAVSASKLDGFTIRQNVLNVFLGKSQATEEKAEDAEEKEADRAKDEL